MSYVTAIGTANPAYRFDQTTISNFMVKAMQLNDDDSRKLKTIFRASGVHHRFSVLEDYGRMGDFTFYPNTPDFEPFPSTQKRLETFRHHALSLSVSAVHNMMASLPTLNLQSVTHLIVVCCTGMYAPGLDIELIRNLALPTTVQRTCITYMGCYAAFNAFKVADALCNSQRNAKVLLVCTELCSLHFQKEPSEDNLIANALFSDGAAAVLIEAEANTSKRLSLERFHNDLALEGAGDMAWGIGDLGFQMKLSAYVPSIIKGNIARLTNELLTAYAKKIEDIKYFAIHPGGKRILEVIEQQLGIQKAQNEAAYYVLRNFGNMSSPTVLFVLREVLNKITAADDGALILSFAFGPGLTLESMLLKIQTT